MTERRTQAERRAETQAAVLQSAIKLFGEHGYAKTSLEDIANDCGISIAPIYHYYKNKKNLFLAASEEVEKGILPDSSAGESIEEVLVSWEKFLTFCQDPIFRRIVLIDGPHVLGRERMFNSKVSSAALERMRKRFKEQDGSSYKAEIMGRMLIGALAEAGIAIGNAADPEQASKDAESLVIGLVAKLKS